MRFFDLLRLSFEDFGFVETYFDLRLRRGLVLVVGELGFETGQERIMRLYLGFGFWIVEIICLSDLLKLSSCVVLC